MTGGKSIWSRDILSWALYDFANTIYSMNVVSLYLKRYIIEDLGYDDRYFDIPFSISMLIAAVLLPPLGAISDHSARKKMFLLSATLLCCGSVALMGVLPAVSIWLIAALFIVANFAYETGQPFYNALLYSVADGRHARYVSGVGVALGYVGSVVGMGLVLPFVTGTFYGIDIPGMDGFGKAGAYLPTAALFLLFALPVFLAVREKPVAKAGEVGIRGAYREVWHGIRQTRKYPGVLRFLIADYFFEDAVTTVILNMGVFTSVVLGLGDEEITLFFTISTLTAVIGSFVIGKIAQYWSLKNLLAVIVAGWIVSLVAFVMTDSMVAIWLLGSFIGVLLGGLWTTSRPLLAELVPRDELGRFFGLFSLSGRAAAVIGPLVWTTAVYLFRPERSLGRWVVDMFGLTGGDAQTMPYRVAVLSLGFMMLIGLYIFRKVPHTSRSADA